MDQAVLIARKHEIQGRLAQARRELTWLEAQVAPRPNITLDASPDRSTQRRISHLQTKIDQLMAEEYRLRLAIDRTNR
jgi:hypothetical protein